VGSGNNGYQCGDAGGCRVGAKSGYGMLIQVNSDDNLIQGNLLLANQGKAVFRILGSEVESTSVDRNMVRDNAFLFGEGQVATDDCVDDSNQFLNNISYGNYVQTWYTKGNLNGSKGHHTLQHNLFYVSDFSRMGVGMWTGGVPQCGNYAGYSYKIANTMKDNIFYSNGPTTGQVDSHTLLDQRGPQSATYAQADHNLFWAQGAPSTWTTGFTFHSTDIHSSTQQPIFVDQTNGDFSLAAGSPGKNAASDGTDIGITYNSYLKKTWLNNAFTLPTQRKSGLTTSAAFTVDPNHFYQIWFYIPTTNPYTGIETFNVERNALQRDIGTLVSGSGGSQWVQPGGPARWITLGRAKASDGTLNISWSNPGSANQIFIRQIPTAEEAYAWIVGTSPLSPPQNLRILQVE
jgi:hypothetical protein